MLKAWNHSLRMMIEEESNFDCIKDFNCPCKWSMIVSADVTLIPLVLNSGSSAKQCAITFFMFFTKTSLLVSPRRHLMWDAKDKQIAPCAFNSFVDLSKLDSKASAIDIFREFEFVIPIAFCYLLMRNGIVNSTNTNGGVTLVKNSQMIHPDMNEDIFYCFHKESCVSYFLWWWMAGFQMSLKCIYYMT